MITLFGVKFGFGSEPSDWGTGHPPKQVMNTFGAGTTIGLLVFVVGGLLYLIGGQSVEEDVAMVGLAFGGVCTICMIFMAMAAGQGG